MRVGIVDYGMGNLHSVASAITYLGGEVCLLREPEALSTMDANILPGVGSYRKAIRRLTDSGFAEALRSRAASGGPPLLGICLGMQLLGRSSTEDGFSEGLGLVDLVFEKFSKTGLKVPHVGFNSVVPEAESLLFAGLDEFPSFYFVHSFRALPLSVPSPICQANCDYSSRFVGAFEAGKVCGTQFHPELSQSNGLRLLQNFLTRF